MRHDGRAVQQLRPIKIETNVFKHPEGSVIISFGDTKVICSATLEESVPPFLRNSGTGWVTAEYSMLPRATNTRNRRESAKGKLTGRTMEIQRLIGRSLRAVIDLEKLGERSIIVDCDVIQADGGTRTASITGGFVALRLAINKLLANGELKKDPIKEHLAAISVGVLPEGTVVTDLDYQEDSSAAVDMNLVMTESGRFVEIQGTGEEATFDDDELNALILHGKAGIQDLIAYQKEALLTEIATEEKTIVIATRNPGKAKEFAALFAKEGYQTKTLLDYPNLPDVEETGTTFEENARLKAETIAQILQQPVLADDSGLVVDALNGMPGIFSARFAGERKSDAANNAKLLHELTDVPDEKRTAHFHCTLVFAAPQKESLVVEADWDGRIGRIPQGDNGFGYDPLFIVPEYRKTSAELTSEEKNQISHRGMAVKKLEKVWKSWLEENK
ncbi:MULTISPECIES: ribonuclease PH [Enterococcus]|uniref:Multifunctional fusion protein n=1 Tax=Enterococcus malodoratus ATCC 43197 TaxID=1158601 RepID=R2RME2_9ENTE|nr:MULTISPECIES: ribonuclease PH [Enterococcus]EOH81736.1 ribonuclease PH [Enterococcus malodoratus ATCC 43197]EOT68818.1 ribonuclease PH [Enterococcus malodoratus ATCC 43197]OJG64888.1 ribonuclease PH [Enterococcus malodoratus]SPW86489.1 Ribonuclease PH/Ham1 protein [Enterococcus malodoratus]STC71825.1 Ribonuclease PH/Ham1 protein [Enterococcus malodoratus]